MMRKNLIRTTCLLSFLLLGALYSASISIKQAAALPITEYQREYLFFNATISKQISSASQTALVLDILDGGQGVNGWDDTPYQTSWKNNLTLLKSELSTIDTLYKTLPYNIFSMDVLLRKYDFALQTATNLTLAVDRQQVIIQNWIFSSHCSSVSAACLVATQLNNQWATEHDETMKSILALGSLFTKAKLEMLEFPRLICNPLQVTVAGHIYCTGQSVNGTATLTLINTQTQQTTSLGTAQADSFFDVFFDITLPNTAGTGHYQLMMTDSGGAQASSFFDVFVTLPTPFEPATIIPITVLIAAVATLAVASRRVRRPL